MANPAHLALLEKGIEAWNTARRQAGDLPDLEGADLSGRALAGIELFAADLRGANLQGCNLEAADLRDTWLEGADLRCARLGQAQLGGARMARCRFDGAVFVTHDEEMGDATQLAAVLRGADSWRRFARESAPFLPELPLDAQLAKLQRTQQALAQDKGDARFNPDDPFDSRRFDETHLVRLCAGVDDWNAWRSENPGIAPQLDGADLAGAELEGANLSAAFLRGARLTGANLRTADLGGADLCEAWLCWTDLSGISAVCAGFVRADLTGADLSRANLYGASFAEANLTGAQLYGANLDEAHLEEADFFEGNALHLARFYEDGDAWNDWRSRCPALAPDLRGANFIGYRLLGEDLTGANLARAHLSRIHSYQALLACADLTEAWLVDARLFAARLESANFALATLARADLSMASAAGASFIGANLEHADLGSATLAGARLGRVMLHEADLASADLSGADLTGACLSGANLRGTNLTDADLTDAVLTYAQMVETVVDGARLTGANVYGVAAWGLDLSRVRDQTNLHITPEGRAGLTVDNLELAQFVYLMVHNEKIRGIIDTIGRKAVLILGRFYAERKALLDALKVRLREFDLVPIVFDWDKPTSRDLTETVALLASMSRFVVADVTDAKSIPQELSEIVPRLPSVPVQPILLRGDPGYAMFEHWTSYRTMLPVYQYRDQADLLDNVQQAILAPVTAWEAGATKQAGLEDELKAKDAEIERLKAMLQMKDGAG
ncbi:MAG: pentapeptide repeat-containing protein [Betaproteobacteria bacterium]|nr:MAG: pentapeptide repeat-containing protein [Betaproteobacteria bacterium]